MVGIRKKGEGYHCTFRFQANLLRRLARSYPHLFEDGGGVAAMRKRVERLKELIDEFGRETAEVLRTDARKTAAVGR